MIQRFLLVGLSLVLGLLLAGCGADEPRRLGFLGAMSGHYADLGLTGRNGALLAVEQRNAAGGIRGRPVELLIRDDAQHPETAVKAVQELRAARVELLIGPLTSEMASAILPVAEQAGLIMISPIAAATSLAGRDDALFRLGSTGRDYARISADFYYHSLGLRRIAVIYDMRNRTFADDMQREFHTAFSALGGVITLTLPFTSTADVHFTDLARTLLDSQPDALLFITNALDTVRLCQQARKQAPNLPLMATVWAATEQLVELGGRDVEGLYLAQLFNREDTTPRYQAFHDAYRQRFQQEPGFVSLAAYDAANIALEALSRRTAVQSLKETLLQGSFTGAQQTITFDPFGDASRQSLMTMIRNGRFVIIP
ncbi:MAG TPA: amino acid ABC transporter substrate-binding protein [Gammaproteobacteria bacterium]|nr:amino acid ABC transporter substrate-binding protein [Gammaproteobacteria bacterium]